jgi:hypothetical protein
MSLANILSRLIIVCFLLNYSYCQGQYFSKIYPLLGQTDGFISSIQIVNDTIYAMSSVVDTAAPYNVIAVFNKFDKSGNLLSSNPFRIPGRSNIGVDYNSLIKTKDGGFAYGELSGNFNPIANFLLILKYDRYGNFQWYKEIPMPDSTYFNCPAFIQDRFSNYYLCGGIGNDITGYIHSFIAKTDSSGNSSVIKYLSDSGYINNSAGLTINNDQIVMGGGYGSLDEQNFTIHTGGPEIYVLDTGLNLVQHIMIDSNPSNAGYIHMSGDNGYICGDAIGCYFDTSIIKNKGGVNKLDSNFNILWTISNGPCSQSTSFYGLSPSPDGNFISVGQSYDDTDTLQTHQNGWLMKYSLSGQILWNRLYRGITSDGPNGDDNVILSIAFMSDSSIVCAGQALTYDGNATPPQQGWLLHLDKSGCLPDSNSCGVADGIAQISKLQTDVKVYPNPAADRLNIQYVPDGSGVNIAIYNLLGQTIYESQPISSESILSVEIWLWK